MLGIHSSTLTPGRVPVSDLGPSYSVRPDRLNVMVTNERSIITSVYTRMAVDISSIKIRHVRVDDDERFVEEIKSSFNDCLKVEANIDQAPQAFLLDIASTLFDNGVSAVVAVDTTLNPEVTGSFDILSMRVGNIVQWYPQHVRISLYNEKTGRREEITLQKRNVAIIENPFYAIMNAPNSTLQRLIRKLGLLDTVDEQS
jgi:septum formation topological specificity factor MinE